MKNAFKQIIKCSLSVFLVVNVFMAIAMIKSYTYLLGWIVGSFASITGFALSFCVNLWIGSKAKTRAAGFMASFIKTVIVLMLHALHLFIVMAINVYFSNEKMWEFTINAIINPINFFTYLGGISLVPMGTIVWGIMSMARKGGNAKVRYSI